MRLQKCSLLIVFAFVHMLNSSLFMSQNNFPPCYQNWVHLVQDNVLKNLLQSNLTLKSGLNNLSSNDVYHVGWSTQKRINWAISGNVFHFGYPYFRFFSYVLWNAVTIDSGASLAGGIRVKPQEYEKIRNKWTKSLLNKMDNFFGYHTFTGSEECSEWVFHDLFNELNPSQGLESHIFKSIVLGNFKCPQNVSYHLLMNNLRLRLINRRQSRVVINADEIFGEINHMRTQWNLSLPLIEDILLFESMSFEQQAYFMNDTDIIIAPHGAGLINMLFMRPCSIVIEILPRGYENHCFENIAMASGVIRKVIVNHLNETVVTDESCKDNAELQINCAKTHNMRITWNRLKPLIEKSLRERAHCVRLHPLYADFPRDRPQSTVSMQISAKYPTSFPSACGKLSNHTVKKAATPAIKDSICKFLLNNNTGGYLPIIRHSS